MHEIVLTEEQARLLAGETPVYVRDPSGAVVRLVDWEAAAIAQHKERRGTPRSGPWYTGDQVGAGLDALQAERDRIGPFDHAYAEAFLRRLEAADPAKYGPVKEQP